MTLSQQNLRAACTKDKLASQADVLRGLSRIPAPETHDEPLRMSAWEAKDKLEFKFFQALCEQAVLGVGEEKEHFLPTLPTRELARRLLLSVA